MPVLVYSTSIARSAQTDLPTGDTGPHIPRTDLHHKLPIEIKPQVITTPNGHWFCALEDKPRPYGWCKPVWRGILKSL